MMNELATPMGMAIVTWLTFDEGGRRTGPPTAPVYAANCAFPLGGEPEIDPGWPATAGIYSLLLGKQEERSDGSWLCAIDFLARDLVADYVSPGAPMLVMEGPKIVGHAVIVSTSARPSEL